MNPGNVHIEGTLAVVGGGRMGEAIAAGLAASGVFDSDRIVIAEPVAERREALRFAHGVRCVGTAPEAASEADIVLLAVKPQVMEAVLAELFDSVQARLVISIAAGISSARIESGLPDGTAVVRVMPNTPALVREGMSVICGGSSASAEQVDLVRELFSVLGKAIVLDEHAMDAATAISGSGPAYVALVVDALARSGVMHGLPRHVAEELAVQTVSGTAALIDRTGQHPEQVVDAVSSPGGTTIAAVEALEAYGTRAAVNAAVTAAVERAKELGT